MHPPPPNNENVRPSSSSSSKMLSQLPPTQTQSSPHSFQHQNFYTPSRPSPLSSSSLRANRSPLAERDENVSHSFTMSSPPQPTTNIFCAQIYEQSSQSVKSTEKRVVKKNPLIHRDEKDGGRETRRKLFLKRVREDSEHKRWTHKGGDDELLRSIYLSDHKRNIGKNLHEDRAYDEIPEDFELEAAQPLSPLTTASAQLPPPPSQQPSISQPIPKSLEEEMADEVARQEEEELQAYLETMEADEAQSQFQSQLQTQQQHHPSQYSHESHITQQARQKQPQISWQGQHQANGQYTVPHIQASASDEIDYDRMFEDMNMDSAETLAQRNRVPEDENMMDMS